MSMQSKEGQLPYEFSYPYYVDSKNYFKPGWVSGMDSGHFLSVLARAYNVTNNSKYREAAEKELAVWNKPIEEGGMFTSMYALHKSLKKYKIYEEYPCLPPTYTLNGFMFTLIGLYDWSCVADPTSEIAKEYFDLGIKTLVQILPYYDIGGFTAYDLSHITWGLEKPHVGVPYHRYHIVFCKIFYDITGIEEFNYYYKLWASYVE